MSTSSNPTSVDGDQFAYYQEPVAWYDQPVIVSGESDLTPEQLAAWDDLEAYRPSPEALAAVKALQAAHR